jgi:uncharacterized membrane protein YecN with MAPEG domain
MRRLAVLGGLAGAVDASDVLLVVGAGVLGIAVYLLWSVWVWAYLGAVLIVAGVLHDLGRRSSSRSERRQGRDGSGTGRPGR